MVAAVLALIGLSSRPAGASPVVQQQAAPGDELRIVSVDTSAFPSVEAVVAVPQRLLVSGDLSSDFAVTSSGLAVPVAVEPVAAAQRPLALLVDNASDTPEDVLAAELGAASELVRELDPGTPIILGTSSGALAPRLITDQQDALTALGAIIPGASRDWPGAIAGAVSSMPVGSKATVIVISAGGSTTDGELPAAVLERLQSGSVTVRWIALTPGGVPTGVLAGVQSVSMVDSGGLLVRLDSIAADLASQYAMTFTVDPRATSATITLAVDGTSSAVQTPLPLPGPAFVGPTIVTSASAVPTPRIGTATVLPGTVGTAATTATAATAATTGIAAKAAPQLTLARQGVVDRWVASGRRFIDRNTILFVVGLVALFMLVILLVLVTDRSPSRRAAHSTVRVKRRRPLQGQRRPAHVQRPVSATQEAGRGARSPSPWTAQPAPMVRSEERMSERRVS